MRKPGVPSVIVEDIIREGIETGEFRVGDPAEVARVVGAAFTSFSHPVLIEHRVQHGEDTGAGLRGQIRMEALGKLPSARTMFSN